MMAPLPYLFFGVSLIKPNSMWFLALIYAPMMLGNFFLFLKMFRYPVKSLVLDVVSFPTYTAAFFSSLFKHSLGFVVTIKKYEREKPWAVYKPQIVIATALSIGLCFSLSHHKMSGYGAAVNYFWALFDALFLWFGFYLIVIENLNWNVWETRKKAAPQAVQAPVQLPVQQPVAQAEIEIVPQRERVEDWSPSWEPHRVKAPLPSPLRWPVEKLRAKRRAFREWNNAEWR